MNPISEFSATSQWAFGTMGSVGGGVLLFLEQNYKAFGSIGILVGAVVGIHGAYWLGRIKWIEWQIKRIELAEKRGKAE